MAFTYLIKSLSNRNFYTGISEDPKKRLVEHNSGKLKTTAKHKPFDLIYFQVHNDYGEARKHELWLKKKNKEYKNKLTGIFNY